MARKLQQENEFINPEDFIDIDLKTAEHNVYNFGEDVAGKGTRIGAQRIRSRDIPFKRSYDLIKDYQEDLISGYYRNLMKFKAQNEIDVMMHNMKSYKPNATEKAYFKDLYKGVSKKNIPDKLRYNSYVDVWADFVKRYAEDSLGNKIGQDKDSMEYVEEWSEICLAMATITEQMEEEPMINQYVEE